MSIFQIGGPEQSAANQQLALLRGFAINAYAGLEQILSFALAHVGGMSMATAATIFFKISNSRSRNEIIITLKKRKYGDKHNLFWNSIFKEVGQLDEKRNRIVHWHSVSDIGLGETTTTVESHLMSPSNLFGGSAAPMKAENLIDFIQRCDVFSRGLSLLILHWSSPEVELGKPLLDIFQQALTYPIPLGHPLSPTPEAPSNPPPSSPQ